MGLIVDLFAGGGTGPDRRARSGFLRGGFCIHGRPHRDGRRVLCFADWSRDYGVPAWFTRNGYVQDVSFCRNQCLKRPDIVEMKLEGSEKCSVPAAPTRG